MKPHAKSALSLALAIVGGIAAGMSCDASVTVETSSQFNPRPAAYTVKAYTEGFDPFIPMPRPQSSVKSSVRTVDKTVDWSVDKTAGDSTNERILNLLATNPRATQEELARVLGLSVRGIEYAIGTLKKAKRIRKVGGKRFGHWEVNK